VQGRKEYREGTEKGEEGRGVKGREGDGRGGGKVKCTPVCIYKLSLEQPMNKADVPEQTVKLCVGECVGRAMEMSWRLRSLLR